MDPRNPPQARVAFPPGFAARVASFARAEVAGRRTPREDFASSTAVPAAGGGEFAGRRRYRPGDDVRALDWEALARGAGALVRLRDRESAERWCIALDGSASMAIGDPAKLQLAAELALAVCALGVELRNTLALATPRGLLELRAKSDLARALGELEGLASAGAGGFETWLGHAQLRRASRWILIGDSLGLEPAALGPLAQRGRRVDVAAVLAPIELAPHTVGLQAVEWRDPERDQRWQARLGETEAAAYAGALSEHLEHWRALAARTGGRLVVARAGDAFEPHARRLLASAGR